MRKGVKHINIHFSKDFELGKYTIYDAIESLQVCVNAENNENIYKELYNKNQLELKNNDYHIGSLGQCIPITRDNINKISVTNNVGARKFVKLSNR